MLAPRYGTIMSNRTKTSLNKKVTEFEHTNTEENIQKISDSISQMGIENVEITKGEKGLTISIENIQFMPDSSELMPSEKEKLTKISEILKNFPLSATGLPYSFS